MLALQGHRGWTALNVFTLLWVWTSRACVPVFVFFIEMVEFRLQCIQYFGFEVHWLCNSRGLGVVAEYMYRGPS